MKIYKRTDIFGKRDLNKNLYFASGQLGGLLLFLAKNTIITEAMKNVFGFSQVFIVIMYSNFIAIQEINETAQKNL